MKAVLLDFIITLIKSELMERLILRAVNELLGRDDSEIDIDKANKIKNEVRLARANAGRGDNVSQ